jgi:hypothetical protein
VLPFWQTRSRKRKRDWGTKDKTSPQRDTPVTCFIQLSPTSSNFPSPSNNMTSWRPSLQHMNLWGIFPGKKLLACSLLFFPQMDRDLKKTLRNRRVSTISTLSTAIYPRQLLSKIQIAFIFDLLHFYVIFVIAYLN